MEHDIARLPNILITGTPGTGKTSLAARIAELTGMIPINVGDLVKSKSLHDGYDDEYDCLTLNEDKLCDELEIVLSTGGHIVDFHSSIMFPVRWFPLVLVLRSSTDVLYTRLESRGYNANKITENMEAEILQVCLDEAREGWEAGQVVELQSDSIEQLEENAERFVHWLTQWKQDNTHTSHSSSQFVC